MVGTACDRPILAATLDALKDSADGIFIPIFFTCFCIRTHAHTRTTRARADPQPECTAVVAVALQKT